MEHEQVIPDCLLATPAIWVRLGDDLLTENLSALPLPAPRVVQIPEVTGRDEDPSRLANPVIVGGRASRVLPGNLPQVQIGRMAQMALELPLDQSRLADQVDGPDPVDQPDRQLQG